MRGIKNKIILSLFLTLIVPFSAQASSEDSLLEPVSEIKIQTEPKQNTNYFNLANIVDTLLTNDNKTQETGVDKKSQIRKNFIDATSKFNQGNAKVAYDEYDVLINKIENDSSLLALSKVFYEIGYFSLANKAIEKIVYKNQFYDNIADLEKSYKPKNDLTYDDEIYFAKLYSSIYFDNSAQEAVNDLLEKKLTYQKNDYYNYILSCANLELKEYSKALDYINKAISINPNNVSYKIQKLDILINSKKYKDAQNLIEKLEKSNSSVIFTNTIALKKEIVLANTSSNDDEKKYHIANKSFIEGNYEKTKKDCQNILNFDKDNDKIITLYAKSELALDNIERANVYFVNSYKENKNNIETLIGLGDIKYLHGDYKNAVKTYKKAYDKDKDNYEALIKLTTAHRQYAQNPKELKKLELKLDKMPKTEYISYYNSAISIAQKNDVLKEEFLKRALEINPMYENALGELVKLNLKNKNYKNARGLIYNAAFTLEKNYYYYYLCALYSQAMNKKQDAIHFYKTSLNLNPNFEIANIKLLKLIPSVSNEEI